MLSLLFAFIASALGYWPLIGRLWLFLPAIIFIFTPIGIDFIHDRIKYISKTIIFSFFIVLIIYFSINLLGYIGKNLYAW